MHFERTRHRISLHGLIHFLFELAWFNRLTPAMEGKRNQGVLQKYLTAAAHEVMAKRVPLAERLYFARAGSTPRRATRPA